MNFENIMLSKAAHHNILYDSIYMQYSEHANLETESRLMAA